MSWWRRVNCALKAEPEVWLAYLYGQCFHDLKHLRETGPRYHGVVLRILIYCYKLLLGTKLGFRPHASPAKFLVYAGTLNQKNALESTIKSLRSKGQSVVAVAPKSILNENELKEQYFYCMSLGILELFKILMLTAKRLAVLMPVVRAISPLLYRTRINVFLEPHLHLIYFDKLLSIVQPEYVIVSNDHNTPNRSLLALARQKGCKTVYMQHASVSSIFPALNVDYAFLDGMSAYETYMQCETNKSDSAQLLSTRRVILSGQKKLLSRVARTKKLELIGLAVNSLDKFKDITKFVDEMTKQGISLKIRWHPSFTTKFIKKLKTALFDYQVQYSDPLLESINDFLASVDALIAGNSSVHLESALCGVPTFYYELTESATSDYYGYVKNGVTCRVINLQNLKDLIDEILGSDTQINMAAVRYYSATYGTEWEGKEGDLVASFLATVDRGSDYPNNIITYTM